MQKLQKGEENDARIPEFVPSFTPQKTNLQALLMNKPGDLESATAVSSVLEQDFTRTSMEYLVNPEP